MKKINYCDHYDHEKHCDALEGSLSDDVMRCKLCGRELSFIPIDLLTLGEAKEIIDNYKKLVQTINMMNNFVEDDECKEFLNKVLDNENGVDKTPEMLLKVTSQFNELSRLPFPIIII